MSIDDDLHFKFEMRVTRKYSIYSGTYRCICLYNVWVFVEDVLCGYVAQV